MALDMNVHNSLPHSTAAADLAGASGETRDAAQRLVEAIAARDFEAIAEALAPDARFRYLIPPGPSQIVGTAAAAAKFVQWFGDADVLTVQSVRVERLADRISARYRFLLRRQEGWEVIEQQMYLDVDQDGRIAAIDLLCSGFRPAGGPESVAGARTAAFA